MISTRGLEMCKSIFLECQNELGVLLEFSEWEPQMLNPAVFWMNLHTNSSLTNSSLVERH